MVKNKIVLFFNKYRKSPWVQLKVLLFLMLALVLVLQPVAYAMTPQERRDYAQRGITFIDDPCPSGVTQVVDSNGAYQDANARIIIGIAKTYQLEKQGALVGVITAIAEGNLRNLANDGTYTDPDNFGAQPYINTTLAPFSLGLPHDGVGNDHDSVGIMQQRPSQGWSTFGSGFGEEIIEQLMTPAYAAQAFYGTPPDATLPEGLANPGAVRKGVLNLPGGWAVWRNKDPAETAQAVQRSAYPDRYDIDRIKADANALVERLWDSSPVVPLPISITGGSAPTVDFSSCGVPGALNGLEDTIVAYAWPDYRNPRCGRECAEFATTKKPEYAAAIDTAKASGGYVGYNGVDCGGFVTRAMIDSGLDPGYNPKKGNTASQIIYLREQAAKPDGLYTQVTADNLQFGDIAIRSGVENGRRFGHTYIYTGKFLYTSPSGADSQWSNVSASASGSGDRFSGEDRAPMASGADTPSKYEWYRLRSAPVTTNPGGFQP